MLLHFQIDLKRIEGLFSSNFLNTVFHLIRNEDKDFLSSNSSLQNKQERYRVSAIHINANGVTLRSRRFHVQLKKSAQLRAGGDGVADHYQIQLLLALLRVDGGQEHTIALLAHHLPGRQVGDGD